jgi:PEP-CTERM motif
MKKLSLSLGILAVSLIVGSSAAKSQTVTIFDWNAGNITGDSDVIKPVGNQIVVDAYSFSYSGAGSYAPNPSITSPVVNGVTFTMIATLGVHVYTTANGNVALTEEGALNQFGGNSSSSTAGGTPFTSLSPDYQNVLTGSPYSNNGGHDGALALNNLVVGASYELVLWASQPTNGTRAETITALSDGSSWSASEGGSGTLGSWFTATFTATQATEDFTYVSSYDSTITALELIETPVAAPEPSTVALLSMAAGLVGWVAVRRRGLVFA